MGGQLKPFGTNIWIADGPPVNFYGFAYPVRMTVMRLDDGRLFIHSPIAPEPELVKEVTALGAVAFVVSPNKIHHLYLGHWRALFGDALMYASPGLAKKRTDLHFDGELGDAPETAWAGAIDQLIFKGSRVMREVVFFHKPSGTLILADLIENFPQDWFTGWKGLVARMTGITEPDGRAPLDWRLTFFGGRRAARKCVARIKAWHPQKIIIAHGTCYEHDAMAEIERAFRWAA